MRILYMGNNLLGFKIAYWLKAQNENIVGVVVHPESRGKYRDEILACCATDAVFDASTLQDPDVLEQVRVLKPDIALSIFIGYILRDQFINLFPQGVVNLHPSLLPFNRGAYPNVWSIVENTPAGGTLHYIDAGIDTGDIIAQESIAVEPIDTGQTLYAKLEDVCFNLFIEQWPHLKSGAVARLPQSPQAGTSHRVQDVKQLDEIKLDQEYTARALIDILRARTFAPYNGAYFYENGRKVYVRLELYYDDKDGDHV